MSNSWKEAAQKNKAHSSAQELVQCKTMNLRCVIKLDKSQVIEQMIEYRDKNNSIIDAQWVEIPVIIES